MGKARVPQMPGFGGGVSLFDDLNCEESAGGRDRARVGKKEVTWE